MAGEILIIQPRIMPTLSLNITANNYIIGFSLHVFDNSYKIRPPYSFKHYL